MASLLCLLALAACAPAAVLDTPTAPSPVLPTDTPTVTVQWFPPTRTSRSLPTQPAGGATPEYHPGIGSLIFSDSFTDAAFWNTATTPQGGSMVTRSRLLLSYSGQGPISVTSLRSQPSLADFYAEVTADVSLCSPNDEYGLVFRAQPGLNFYRFVVNCNGQVRLERSHNGQIYPVQDWVSSGDATFGAPARLTLAIWTVGEEMRAFLNDSFQFSVRDPLLRDGTIGFFVFAAGKTTVTASFSDLLVYSVDYALPTPTLIPTWTRKP